ncbi:hypothetical protein CRH03_10055 [Clostridium sp. HMb25]|nr:hypothetical protein CRH03_10055 [Clostridium sp. HMb25]
MRAVTCCQRFNGGWEDASGTDHARCGEEGCLSLPSPIGGCCEGESGRNEFLQGPFALFEAHSRAKFEKTSLKAVTCAQSVQVIVLALAS